MASFKQACRDAGLAFRARVVTGLAVIAPIVVTVWIVVFLFRAIDGILQPIMVRLLGQRIPGVGLLATLLLLYLVGLLVHSFGFRTLLRWSDQMMLRIPFLRDIYGSSKLIMETFTKPEGIGFKRVVTFEYPRPGMRALGFVTNETTLADGTREVAVFLPTTPNPTTSVQPGGSDQAHRGRGGEDRRLRRSSDAAPFPRDCSVRPLVGSRADEQSWCLSGRGPYTSEASVLVVR